MKIHSISLIASALFIFTACPGDDSGTDDTTGQTPTTTSPGTDGSATDTGTATTPATDTTPADSSGEDTSSCEPPMFTECMPACEAVYDCGVESGACMWSGDDEEKKTFVDGCVANKMCGLLAPAVNTCDCAGTIEIISGLSADFAMSCEMGIPGGSGTDSGGSDSGGSDTGGSTGG